MNIPPKRILVPMDPTEASQFAWKQAQILAENFGASVQAAYVRQTVFAPVVGGTFEVPIDLSARVMEMLRAMIGPDADLRELGGGSPDQEIPSWAVRQGFDLIVMGTHGRTGMSRAFLGSVAEAVVRHSSVPVLVVREAQRQFKSVLAPVHHLPYAFDGLLAAAKWAQLYGAKLVALHVIEAPIYRDSHAFDPARQVVEEMLAKLPADLRRATKPTVEIAVGDPAREIIMRAKDHSLIVLAAHPRAFLRELILGTTAERVIRYAPKAVLAVRSHLTRP